MADKDLQAQVDSILSGQGKRSSKAAAPSFGLAATDAAPAKPRPFFSAFVDDHMARASELANEFIKIADEKGLDAAIQAISEALDKEPVAGLVQYALQLFLTHHPEARSSLKLKPLEVRQPNAVRSSAAAETPAAPAADMGLTTTKKKPKKKPLTGATPPEDQVSYWREDPLLNEHHEHWHLVYPLRPVGVPPGTPKPEKGFPLGDRHGELFAYMHQQMLARYDAERLGAGVARVKAFDTQPFTDKGFTAKIPQGYDPGDLQLFIGPGPDDWYKFRARPADVTLSDLTLDESAEGGTNWAVRTVGAKLTDMVKFGNALLAANESGKFDLVDPKTDVTIDTIGSTTEPSANSADAYGVANPKNFRIYGSTHNDGHVHFMLFDNTAPYGVMAMPATAVRDPVFFRWHKLVDDVFYQFQQLRLEPYDFSGGPAVTIRKSTKASGPADSKDIILCREKDLPDSIDGHKFGSRAYNNLITGAFASGKQWDRSFAKGKVKLPSGETIATTDTLGTEIKQRDIVLRDAEGNPTTETVEYLSHEDFFYFIRVENKTKADQNVAVRVFLAPETEVADRRAWIELDKFFYQIRAGERAVIFRPADQSSVVRKPALKPDDLTTFDGFSPVRQAQAWCDCGWPYTLLLPRGTKAGMMYRLLVMFSPGADLNMPDHPDCCTSISYCGLQDLEYPDKVAMGYPFDRKFKKSIRQTVEQQDNWAWRTIKIRCKNP
jgi:tyrosinase